MSTEQNKTIARRCVEEFWNRGDAAVANELFAEDCVFQIAAAPEMGRGPGAAVEFMTYVRSGIHSFQAYVHDMVAEGEKVVVYGGGRGIHGGEQMGAAPTGKEVEMKGVLTLRIVDGKIVEYRGDWDTSSFIQQIGAKA